MKRMYSPFSASGYSRHSSWAAGAIPPVVNPEPVVQQATWQHSRPAAPDKLLHVHRLSLHELGQVETGEMVMQDGSRRFYVRRYGVDGNESEPCWNQATNGRVDTLAFDGKWIYLGGRFSSFAGKQVPPYLARISAENGEADATWNALINKPVSKIGIADQALFAAGSFDYAGGEKRLHLAKLWLSDGTADPDWDWNQQGYRFTLSVLESGLVGIMELNHWQ